MCLNVFLYCHKEPAFSFWQNYPDFVLGCSLLIGCANLIITCDKGGGKCDGPRCFSVCQQDYSKVRAWIWMKFCVSTGVGTWTNWSTFEPDLDYSLDPGTGLLSLISYVLQHGILLRRENPTYRQWAPVTAARRGFKMLLFTASCGNTFVGGTCALPSALLVLLAINYTGVQPHTVKLWTMDARRRVGCPFHQMG